MHLPAPCLILTAAPAEADAIARATQSDTPAADWQPMPIDPGGRLYLARTGVGKVNAAAAALQLIHTCRTPYAAVLNLGIGGALPCAPAPLSIGTIVIGAASVYADEGVQTPDRFLDISEVGFPLSGSPPIPGFAGPRIAGDAALIAICRAAIGPHAIDGDIATVSTCSGTDTLALAVAERTRACVEAMEGAAIAHALARLTGAPIPGPGSATQRIPFCEIRVVSNTTGDRAKQRWDIRGALVVLSDVAAALARALV